MMQAKTFEDMEVWQDARGFVKLIYIASANREFAKDFGLRDQIRRAAASIMSNIAEGLERQTNKEFAQFLYIAKASAAEIRSQLYVALDLNYIDRASFEQLNNKAVSIARQLSGFIKHLKQREVNR